DPLLAPIQVPERHLQRLRPGQDARLTVEAFGDKPFKASVLRIRPVVDATSGTIEVTLEVQGEGLLRPGMFSAVELEMERSSDAVIAPKVALTLDSLMPTVFVAVDGEDGGVVAARRQLELGLRNDRELEVLSGLEVGERVVVVGQDGLADGTPLEIDGAPAAGAPAGFGPGSGPPGRSGQSGPPRDVAPAGATDADASPGADRRGRGGDRRGPPAFLRDLDWNDPAEVEKVKEHLRGRGFSDAEVEDRLERLKARFGGGGRGGADG
ncbi:MAG: efflux RND transporter periplasmic adaptor subunit, partial [Acidobacteriota bacterium]